MQYWVEQARTIRGDDLSIFLVGNKIDDAEKRQVSTNEGEQRAQDLRVSFQETSAKVGLHIKQLFNDIAASLSGVITTPALV